MGALLLCFQYGEIEEMNVCDNLGDHLVGNVYVKVCLLYFPNFALAQKASGFQVGHEGIFCSP